LINEVITNSLKYGFIDTDDNQINISLKEDTSPNTYVLYISDNGIGFTQDIDFKNPKSLGLRLINSLAKQLKGSVSKDLSKKGTNYSISFKDIGQDYKKVA